MERLGEIVVCSRIKSCNLFAFLISGVISAFALKGSREGASYGITGAVTRVNKRIEDSARAEDADDYDDLGPTAQPPAS